MDFDQLHTFLEIVRLKSFSKAAQTCYRTQPAISAQVRQLEQELRADAYAHRQEHPAREHEPPEDARHDSSEARRLADELQRLARERWARGAAGCAGGGDAAVDEGGVPAAARAHGPTT